MFSHSKLSTFAVFAVCVSNASAGWQTIDSFSITARIPAKSGVFCTIDRNANSITCTQAASSRTLTEKAKLAIAYSPRWLSLALEDRFAGLAAANQDRYAQIILDAKDPCVDEIAFTVAHLPNEVLLDNGFYPAVIAENAAGIYGADSGLDYVSIVDSGSAKVGGGYFSTTKYRVLVDGTAEDYVLPREMYYWFVVHPKLQGELPTYISPSDPNPTAPSAGKFWRTFLWTHKEAKYPALRDTMKGMTFLWANKVNSVEQNGVLGRLSQWCNLILPWGDHPQYRWPQPVYLYNQHCGTCSEHGWFANAAARTALIPATLTKAPRMDHKWNEFFDERWIDWEPINGWIDRIDEQPNHANDYWSDAAKPPLGACFNWRGDGYIWGTTERYSKVCTLSVSVNDSKGRPVDGARIIVDSDGEPGNFLLAGWTGSDGLCRFLLGDEVPSFTAAVTSKAGSAAKTAVVSNSLPNQKYDWPVKMNGTVPELKVQQVPIPVTDTAGIYRAAYSIDARDEIVYGKHEYSLYGYSFPCTFSDARRTGSVDFFICDEENMSVYQSGNQFTAAVVKKRAATADSFFTLPPGDAKWNVVLSGEGKTVNTTIATISLRLLRQGPAGIGRNQAAIHKRSSFIKVHTGRSAIKLDYFLFTKGPVSLDLYSCRGRPVMTLLSGIKEAGNGSLSVDGRRLPAGVYLCRMTAGTEEHMMKIVIK